MARGLVLSKLRNRLGLNETRYFITGAAPISKDTQEFFLSLNMPLLEAFGMSETTGPHTLSIPTEFTFSGSRVDGSSRTIIDEPDPTGEGELMIQGRDVFMGYMGNEADTRATFDRDFRMRTGDLARVDNGFLKITGRIKDIVVTAGGENISPVPIEERLKMAVPALVSNCIVVGDRRKYLISLAALRVDTDPVTNAPTDKIAADALAFMKKQCGLPEGIATVSELLASPKAESTRQALNELFKQALNKINREAVSHAARVQLVEILPRDFSLVGGELGPTMKLRRAFVLKLYAELIESIYEKHGINGPQR
jgi:long-chain-fatty-acid--CoA ligase ACSBG